MRAASRRRQCVQPRRGDSPAAGHAAAIVAALETAQRHIEISERADVGLAEQPDDARVPLITGALDGLGGMLGELLVDAMSSIGVAGEQGVAAVFDSSAGSARFT